ncbi:TlpA family protein disulfide reductase [Cerasicoccus arenae]|uniref:Thioredoxin domain-containing protein n=1 Tax=Cerasicoccus arenae TaxID=424488 RepID=A0A8J3DE14_9BACT|nr:thioredoxin domain-containing protein [Cerasicoccus arenae]MBK1856896.1 hypothetical protein [Cerasicoccus arenae]GHB89719.1 hypothetical protein GCM10007047_00210 [Cerasicoccus arenae]
MKKILTVFLIALFGATFVYAGKVELGSAAEPQLYLVKIDASWCGACKALKEPLAELKTELADQPVLFVTLDFTDDNAIKQTTLHVDALKIRSAVDANTATGNVLLLNARNGELIAVLTRNESVAEMKEAVEAALLTQEKGSGVRL